VPIVNAFQVQGNYTKETNDKEPESIKIYKLQYNKAIRPCLPTVESINPLQRPHTPYKDRMFPFYHSSCI
jgi:hypothetical protein